jgi:hypothetical protein
MGEFMKKSFLVPFFALVVLASQSWSGNFCNFGVCVGSSPDGYGCENGGCYWKDEQPQGVCGQHSDEVDVCPAGTLPPKIVEQGGYPTGSVKEWCRWETSCWAIESGGRDACKKDGYIYINVPNSGVGAGKKCEGGTFTGEGKTSDPDAIRQYCDWGTCIDDPNNPYACLEGGCFEITDAAQEADCQRKVATKSQCDPGSLPAADRTPIISIPKAQGLTVISNGRSLHILSIRDANVSLYDLAGNRVLNSKVSKGNNTISLTQKQGVYYAVVTSGAQTQTVKVLLK